MLIDINFRIIKLDQLNKTLGITKTNKTNKKIKTGIGQVLKKFSIKSLPFYFTRINTGNACKL